MSQFPAVKPSSRSLSVGQLPITTFQSMSGKETRVMTGSSVHADGISLVFQNIHESVVQQFLNHYLISGSMLLSFTLPEAVWAGWDLYINYFPIGLKWRYSSPPSVQAVSPGIMTVSVDLVSLA